MTEVAQTVDTEVPASAVPAESPAPTAPQQAAIDAIDTAYDKVFGSDQASEPEPKADDVEAVAGDEAAKDGSEAPAVKPSTPAEPAEPTPAPTDTPALTPQQLLACRRQGFSADDLAKLGEGAGKFAENLLKTQRDIAARYGAMGRVSNPTASPQAAAPVVTQQATTATPAPIPQDDPILKKIEAAAEFAGPDVAEVLKAMREDQLKANQARDAQLVPIQQAAEQQRSRQIEGELDGFFAGLDAKAFPVLAGAPISKLDATDPIREARIALVGEATLIGRGMLRASGVPYQDVPFDQLPDEIRTNAINLALLQQHGAASIEKAREDGKNAALEKVRARSKRGLMPMDTTRVANPGLTGDEKTMRAMDAWERKTGVKFFTD